jgi:segregation and condensation protein A
MSGSVAPPYQVELPVFEGPLDLLLHLVKKHELDIFDIPIAFITEKYLEYLNLMRAFSLEVAGEYLLMAATLMYLKSRELLPAPDPLEPEAAEEGPDPREELIRRLLEYQKYKEAAEHLHGRPVVGRNVWTRGAPVKVDEQGEPPLAEVSVFKLVEALAKLCEKKKIDFSHDVVVDRVSIADRIGELCDLLAARPQVTFEDCFAGVEFGRLEIVTTFLALLEMGRLRMIRLHQPTERGTIYIARLAEDLTQAAAAAAADLAAREAGATGVAVTPSPEPARETPAVAAAAAAAPAAAVAPAAAPAAAAAAAAAAPAAETPGAAIPLPGGDPTEEPSGS